ncbi:MAG: hypothetical protein CMB80_03795 [Flammeovirgaceae bacterium]|nr:hypothetical protein [Flammeovirgaceae bacterium]
MSYNKITVANQTPNVSGEISLDLNNISNISINNATAGQAIQYDISTNQFKNNSHSLKFSTRGAGASEGSTSVSSTYLLSIPNPYHSGYTYFWEFAAKKIAGNDKIDVVSDSNTELDGNSYGGANWTHWLDRVTFLNAGTYYLSAMVHVGENSPSDAFIDVSWTDGSYNSLGPRVRLKRFDDKRIIVRGVYEASVNDVAGLYIYGLHNAYATQSTYINYLVSVEKI